MSVITDPIFRTTYQGDTITRNGVTYVWRFGQYEVSTVPTPVPSTEENPPITNLVITKKVILKFSGIIEPNVELTGDAIKVYVDGQSWDNENVKINANSIEVILDEIFISNQRLITFSTQNGTPKVRYAIKSRVNATNDVVLVKIGVAEDIPVLGTFNVAVVTNRDPYEQQPIGTIGTGNVTNPSIDASINYEQETIQLGSPDYAGNFFNQNNQTVDATIGEVVGSIYE